MVLFAGYVAMQYSRAWHQMKKVSLPPEMAAIIKPLRQIFISAAHMEKG